MAPILSQIAQEQPLVAGAEGGVARSEEGNAKSQSQRVVHSRTLTVLSIAIVIVSFAHELWAKQTGGLAQVMAEKLAPNNHAIKSPTRSAVFPTNLAPNSPRNQPINNAVNLVFTLHPNGDGVGEGITIETNRFRDVDGVIQKHCCELVNVTDSDRCAPNSGARLVNEAGVRLMSFADAEQGNRVYCVVQGTHFIWPLVKVGNKVFPKNVVGPIPGAPIVMRQLSNSPRVFAVDNFVAPEEVEELLRVNKERLTRSEVGFAGWQDDTRTSFTSWDFSSPAALALQKRTFEILGMDHEPELADAMQVLRYTSDGFNGQGEWYKPHVDWFTSDGYDGSDPKVDNGTNRMATMFLYLSDVAEGGCTVFPLSTSHEGYNGEQIVHEGTVNTPGYIDTNEARRACNKTSTALKSCPKQGNAVLFYGQLPDGTLDAYSLHGGCPPVNGGVKWSGNIWIWNRSRPDKSKAKDGPKGGKASSAGPGSFHLTFRNSHKAPLKVYWDSRVGAEPELDQTGAFRDDAKAGGARFKFQYDLPPHTSRVIVTYEGHAFVFVDPNGNVVSRRQASAPTSPDVIATEGETVVV